jgi:hypothetical protein
LTFRRGKEIKGLREGVDVYTHAMEVTSFWRRETLRLAVDL